MKTLLLFLFTLSLQAQAPEGMVLIGGDVSHQIEVPDDLTYDVVERWKHEMKVAGIQFQAPLRKIDRIEYIERDYHYFGEIKNRVIYLNSALKEYPYCNRAAILQMLFLNQGGKVCKCTGTRATTKFNASERTEKMFKRQYENGYIYSYLIRELQ